MRTILPLLAVGLALLLVSVFLVGRDLALARAEAEAEIVAFAETGALAIQSYAAAETRTYLQGLVKHPAIATVTVYSAQGERTTERDPAAVADSSWISRLMPPLREPVVGCRAVETTTLCLQGDMSYYEQRAAALLVPHVILLAASVLLLMVTIVLSRGTNRQQVRQLARIIQGAAGQSDYSVRAREGKGEMGELARATNELLEQMQQRDLMLRRRTTELEAANREMEAFSYSVSHDLRSPLASVDGFSEALHESAAQKLDDSEKEYLKWIRDGVEQMNNLVTGLLQMSRISKTELSRGKVDLSAMANSIADSLRQRDPSRAVDFRIEENVVAGGDGRLLHAVLENLMSNAFKFTGKTENATIEVGVLQEEARRAYFVRDNGAGFDSTQAAKMFTPFQRLHSSSEFEGTGIGLSTVKRIIERHGGAIWADGRPGQGAAFYFTLGEEAGADTPSETAELTRV